MVMQANVNKQDEEDALSHALLQLMTSDALIKIKKRAERVKQSLFEYLLQYKFVAPKELQKTCSLVFKLAMSSANKMSNTDNAIPFDMIKNHFFIPTTKQGRQLVLAIANPNDIEIGKKIAFQTGLIIKLEFMAYDILTQLHNDYIGKMIYQLAYKKNTDFEQKLSYQLFSDAIHRGASDIHIEAYQHDLRIRFRIDGLLHEIIKLPNTFTDAIISCIKVLAHLDIAIKRTPQDGRLSFRTYLGFRKDCRISTCPTTHNEKMVIRLLDSNMQTRSIEQLGLDANNQKILLNEIGKPQGLILVTGPTGSGKTITLYTLLNLVNQTHRNISTIEDPVEMHIDGINQTPVNTKTGLTFSKILRALLRQDPDIIMIGEIRDTETAEMALRAAQTGHLVLSTLHANNAAEAITRLCHMGIAPFHLCSALTLVVAQRLVRKLCAHCKMLQKFQDDILFEAGVNTVSELYVPIGCPKCLTGYSGRIGIFELLPITPALQQLILNRASSDEIALQNNRDGHLNLWQTSVVAVKNGVTSLNEIYRVIPMRMEM